MIKLNTSNIAVGAQFIYLNIVKKCQVMIHSYCRFLADMVVVIIRLVIQKLNTPQKVTSSHSNGDYNFQIICHIINYTLLVVQFNNAHL